MNLKLFVKLVKKTNFILASFFLILFSVAGIKLDSIIADASFTAPVIIDDGSRFPVTFDLVSQNLSSEGDFTVTYKISQDEYRKTKEPVFIKLTTDHEIYTCPEGNGQSNGKCLANGLFDQRYITLEDKNNYTVYHTYYTRQSGGLPCGSYQADLLVKGEKVSGSLLKTGKDLAPGCNTAPSPSPSVSASPSFSPSPSVSPSASPSMSPSPSVSPSPSPSASPSVSPSPNPSPSVRPSPSPVCPSGQVINSQMQCQSQGQNQNQNQNQNNNQEQNNNQNVNATGGSSSSSSNSSNSVNLKIN